MSTLKKIFLVTIVLFTAFFSSCSSEDAFQNSFSRKWTEEEIKSSLKFLTRVYSVEKVQTPQKSISSIGTEFETEAIGGPSISFYIGRKKKKCTGLGICGVVKPPTDLTEVGDEDGGVALSKRLRSVSKKEVSSVVTFLEEEKGQIFALLLLSEAPNSDIPSEQLNMEVEEELILPLNDRDLYVHPGTLTFDKTLGNFGGYKVLLHKNSSLSIL
ncbi:MAG: hypothetical protein MSH18_01950 [Bacteroidales bacterium]|nr:hypothetical protein [Bacteroidales bacterium]